MNDSPLQGILRNILYAVLIAVLYMAVMVLLGRFNAGFLPAYILIGGCFSFFGWGGERLWHAAVKNFFSQPFSTPALAARFPCWAVFGGIGYTIAAVISKKNGMYPFDIIPVKNIFFAGAGAGCCIQSVLFFIEKKYQQV